MQDLSVAGSADEPPDNAMPMFRNGQVHPPLMSENMAIKADQINSQRFQRDNKLETIVLLDVQNSL